MPETTEPHATADILTALRTQGDGGERIGRVTAARAADLIEELVAARRGTAACAAVFGPYACAKVAGHDGEHIAAQAGEWRYLDEP